MNGTDLTPEQRRFYGNELASAQAHVDDERIQRVFAELRAMGRPQWVEPDNMRPFWAVTRHAQIMEVSTRNDVFSSSRRMVMLNRRQEAANVAAASKEYGRVLRSLIHMDPPDHKPYRAVAQSWFTGVAVKQLQPMLDQLTAEYGAKLVFEGGAGRIDFASEIATWFPLRVIMSILGVPIEDLPLMHRLTKMLSSPLDPELSLDASSGDRVFESIPLFADYFMKMVKDRRLNPRDDLGSVIANGTVDGQPMGELETISYFITMATAGHDTTSFAMAGGMQALAERPDQWAALRQRPDLMRTAVDEIIRWVTPIRHFMRTANHEHELGGRTISRGEALVLFYTSGNRDEEVFGDPFEFRVDRTPNRHLAFGFGAHMCMGMVLSRLELSTLFSDLVSRLESVSLDGVPRPIEANFLGGFKSMPIRYRMAA